MAAQHLLLEGDTSMFQADPQLSAALGKLGVKLAFEGADRVGQRGNSRCHGISFGHQSVDRVYPAIPEFMGNLLVTGASARFTAVQCTATFASQ